MYFLNFLRPPLGPPLLPYTPNININEKYKARPFICYYGEDFLIKNSWVIARQNWPPINQNSIFFNFFKYPLGATPLSHTPNININEKYMARPFICYHGEDFSIKNSWVIARKIWPPIYQNSVFFYFFKYPFGGHPFTTYPKYQYKWKIYVKTFYFLPWGGFFDKK